MFSALPVIKDCLDRREQVDFNVKKGIEIRPLKSGGSGVQSYSKRNPRQMPTALEAGTLNAHGIAGLHAALDYLTETGIDTIREKEQALMWEFYEKVRKIPG